jgi:hypothetical protein
MSISGALINYFLKTYISEMLMLSNDFQSFMRNFGY